MRIDLHTHSDRSDGTDSPTELIEKAKATGLDVVAITDHDTTQGWREASRAAKRVGIRLVKGMEMSCRLGGKSVHLLCYEFDPNDRALNEELKRVIDGRNGRLPATLDRLHRLGINIEAADVRRWSGNASSLGRPHVADALVELGIVANRDEAFDRFLMPGRPAYVDRYATDLLEGIALVRGAGGIPVIAHPWSRGSHRVLTAHKFVDLKEAGLAGLEVDHNDHDAEQRASLRQIARELDLIQTGSSDYHGTGKIDFDLGCNLTAPNQFEALLHR
ncbi:MAG: PHP domain-containing protein [Aeromicrobium sp.]